jgi:hypothetical protein
MAQRTSVVAEVRRNKEFRRVIVRTGWIPANTLFLKQQMKQGNDQSIEPEGLVNLIDLLLAVTFIFLHSCWTDFFFNPMAWQ